MVNRKKQQSVAKSSKDGQESSEVSQSKRKRNVKKTKASESKESKNDEGKDNEDESKGSGTKRPLDEPEGIVLQSSGRISKRPKKEYDPYSPPRKPAPKKPAKTPETRKGRRNWELWTVDDKKHFFEALKEYGRDWKGLYEYLKKHNKNKNVPERSQERIRQFYYRIWHKISKYLNCPDFVDKQALEIFGLICYGEMRKRIGSYMDAAIGEKLNEMVHKGSTYMKWREKGSRKVKTFRLKTPHCTVLQKLNNLEGLKLPKMRTNPLRLPEQITVELRPRNNAAWSTVQSIAQNPRLRTKIDSGKRLSDMIDFLNKKWKSHRFKLKENMNEKEKPYQELKLHPPPKVELNPWELSRFNHLKESTSQSQLVLGLQTYMENLKNFGDCSPTARKTNKRTAARKQSSNCQENKDKTAETDSKNTGIESSISKEPNTNSNANITLSNEGGLSKEISGENIKSDSTARPFGGLTTDSEGCSATTNEKTVISFSEKLQASSDKISVSHIEELDKPQVSASSEKPAVSFSLSSPVVSLASPATTYDGSRGDSLASDRTIGVKSDVSSSPETKDSLKKECITKSLSNASDVKTDCEQVSAPSYYSDPLKKTLLVSNTILEKINVIKEGVVRSQAELFSIADLYLMLGNPDKIVLEYEWVDIVVSPDFLDLGHVTNMLRRLIHLASTEFTDFSKPRLPPQLQKLEDKEDASSTCTCGATNIFGTPPHVKVPRGNKSRVKKDPVTPRSSKKETAGDFMSSQASANMALARQLVAIPGEQSNSSGGEFASIEQLTNLLSPPSMSDNQTEDQMAENNTDLMFKIPTAVAPRGNQCSSSSSCNQPGPNGDSPITINNIAQKLSPNALMEHINRANSHTSQPMFLPSSRRKRNVQRVRKPMMVQRKIMPKPMVISAAGPAYVVNGPVNLLAGTPSRPVGNVKVMHPADVKGLTVKSLNLGAPQAMSTVCAPPGVAVRITNSVVTSNKNEQNSSIIENKLSNSSNSVVSQQTSNNGDQLADPTSSQQTIRNDGQVPVTSLESLFSDLISTATTTTASKLTSIISEAALATGISMEISNQGNSVGEMHLNKVSLENSFMVEGSGLSNQSLGGLLDISIPGNSTGDTTDKLIDLALANSSSRFSVSELLDTSCSGGKTNKDPTLSSTRPLSPSQRSLSPGHLRPVTPGQLSPNKVFKPSFGTIDQDYFNLSSFLPESPLKKSGVTSLLSTPKSHDPGGASSSVTLGTSLINENSRDSVRFDVDIALQSMLNENSLDYASKFADLAEEIAATAQEEKAIQSNQKS